MTHNDAIPSEKAQRFYARLRQHAGGDALTTTNAKLAKALSCAYPLVVRWMQELEAGGWISRKQNKQQDTMVHLLRAGGAQLMSVAPTGELPVAPDVQTNDMNFVNTVDRQSSQSSCLGAAQSSQSSQSSRASALISDSVRTTEVNQASSMQAAADLNSVNFELLADFRKRVLAVIYEFGIAGRKRQMLCDAIVALAARHFTVERAEEILADLRRAKESAAVRQRVGLVRSLPAVGICILEEYAETGQMVLFEMPAETPATPEEAERKRQAEREKMRQREASGAKFRRPQAAYSEADRLKAEEEARQRLAARRATS